VIVLDTNVLSELLRPEPATGVVAWVDAQESAELAITVITAAELRAGVAFLPRGRRRTAIGRSVELLLVETFAGSVLPFDEGAAIEYADVVARRRRAGAPITALDAEIAAICRLYGASLATRNTSDFEGTGVRLLDPWAA
jgi:toxin FitB